MRGGSAHSSAHGYTPGQQQPRRQLPVHRDGTISLMDAARDLQERRWGPQGPRVPERPAQSNTGHPTTGGSEAAHAAAALAAPALPASPELCSSSRLVPAGGAPAQQQRRQHSGVPGAPVSPDPSVPPSLRRVSSQPPTALPSGSGCSMATGSTPVHASGGDSTSLEGSRSSRHSSTTGAAGTPALQHGQAPTLAAVAAAAAARPAATQRQAGAAAEQPGSGQVQSPPPPMRWHPALSGARQPDNAVPAAAPMARQPSSRAVHDMQLPSASILAAHNGQPPVSHLPVSLVSVAAAAAAAAADEDEDCLMSPTATLQRSGSAQSVSLLTFMLKGPSAASSLATSREASLRSGMARSREASTRSVSRR